MVHLLCKKKHFIQRGNCIDPAMPLTAKRIFKDNFNNVQLSLVYVD